MSNDDARHRPPLTVTSGDNKVAAHKGNRSVRTADSDAPLGDKRDIDMEHRRWPPLAQINGTVVRPSVGVRAIERPWIVAVWAIMPDSDTYSKAYSKTETYSKTAAKTDRKMPTTCFRVQSCGKKHKDQAGRDGKPLSFHMNTSEINPIHPDAENEQSVHSQSPSLWACHESYWHIFATMNSGRLAGWIGF
jgi:hypothetical protein